MKSAIIYNGSIESEFAKNQAWENYPLAIVASKELDALSKYREQGLLVISYTHPDDDEMKEKISSKQNDGMFLDLAVNVSTKEIDKLKKKLRRKNKILIVNTGWGSNERSDYGSADMAMVESFIGSNSGDDGIFPVTYSRRPDEVDIGKVRELKACGYEVVAISYGESDDLAFCEECKSKAEHAGADYYIYSQPPMWEMPGCNFKFWKP